MGYEEIQIRDLTTGNWLETIDRNRCPLTSPSSDDPAVNKIYDLAFYKDYMAVTAKNLKQVEIWDLRTGFLLHCFKTEDYPCQIKFGKNYLVAGLANNTAKAWYVPESS